MSEVLNGKTDVIGVAVAINGQVEGAEVYGSAALCAKLWPKLLKSAATDALAEFDTQKKFEPATAKAVEAFLADAAKGTAKEVDAAAANNAQQRQAPNAPPLPQQVPAQAAQAPAPAVPMAPPRVRLLRYDTAKALLLECQDKEKPGMVIHRSYIAK